MAPLTMHNLALFLVLALVVIQSAIGIETLEDEEIAIEERALNGLGNLICPEYNCSQWGQWGSCPVTCGGAERVRSRTCNPIVPNPKEPCATRQTFPCGMDPCPTTTHCPTTTTATPSPTPTPPTPGVNCSKCPNTINYVGYMADPKDCSKYYVCIFNPLNPKDWRAVRKPCPTGLLWSQTILTCVRPGFKPDPCGADSPCGMGPGQKYSPSPKNCNAYYECAYGTATLKCCPPGQGWIQQQTSCGNTVPPCTDKCSAAPPSGSCDFDQYFYMPCNDTGAIFPKDHSCNHAHITNVGKVTRNINGKFGPGCSFNKLFKTKLEVPIFSNWFYNVQAVSAVLWFKPGTHQGANTYQYLLHNGDCKVGPSISMYLWRGSSGPWQVRARVNGHLVGYVDVTLHEWVFAALVFNGNGIGGKLYTWSQNTWQNRDNNLIAGPVENNHCPLTFGRKLGKYAYNGLMDEARIFKRALTYAQVQNLQSQNHVQ